MDRLGDTAGVGRQRMFSHHRCGRRSVMGRLRADHRVVARAAPASSGEVAPKCFGRLALAVREGSTRRPPGAQDLGPCRSSCRSSGGRWRGGSRSLGRRPARCPAQRPSRRPVDETGIAGHPASRRCLLDHKAYYPGAHQLHLRLTGDRQTGRLLGAQLPGHQDAEVAKRIDIPRRRPVPPHDRRRA